MHVRGYKENGTTTTPFDMVMLNDLDRYHLVIDVSIGCRPRPRAAAGLPPGDGRRPVRARAWTREHGEDIPEVADWAWGS